MKKSALVLLMGLGLVSTGSMAAGFQGPGATAISNVAQAKQARHDTYVTLTGNIVSSLGDENYMFQDSSGQIRVEIDDDDWYGITVNPQTKVTIYGEVDRYMMGTEIDVDRIQLAQ